MSPSREATGGLGQGAGEFSRARQAGSGASARLLPCTVHCPPGVQILPVSNPQWDLGPDPESHQAANRRSYQLVLPKPWELEWAGP